jgi:hypothetical protein
MDTTDLIFAISIGMVVVLALSAAGVFGRRKR